MTASRLDAGLYWLLMGGLAGVWLGDKMGRPLLGAGLGATGTALFMPHLHPDYGQFVGARPPPTTGLVAHPEDTADKRPGIGYYAIPTLLGAVAGATAGEGKDPGTRLAFAAGAGGGAAMLAYLTRPAPLPPARNADQELAWEAIIQAEKDNFGNVVALSMWGPLTYWSATKADHPLLALALMGGGVAMVYGAAQNMIGTKQLRRRFEAAVARTERIEQTKLRTS